MALYADWFLHAFVKKRRGRCCVLSFSFCIRYASGLPLKTGKMLNSP